MKRTTQFLLPVVMVTLISAGCSTVLSSKQKEVEKTPSAPPVYIGATQTFEPQPEPLVVKVPVSEPDLKPMPTFVPAESNQGRSEPTTKVLREVNQQAKEKPIPDGFYNAIMKYSFEEGKVYEVHTGALKTTDVMLQPGEKIMGNLILADTIRWTAAITQSMKNGQEQQHIIIKPKKVGISTTLTVLTNRRAYHLELFSHNKSYMVAVSWDYPEWEFQQASARVERQQEQQQQITANQIDLTKLNMGYVVDVEVGDVPKWMPVQVFDDGLKTYIKFPPAMLVREAPTLFVLAKNGETQLVNYRVKNEFYIVDRLFERAELRLGQQNQTIVRIFRDELAPKSARLKRRGNGRGSYEDYWE